MVDPLPHQITAVYGEMLPQQPLRFLLADDPGARQTIMAGLLIKELLIRGDLHRCMIVCPGNLAEQWQDELSQRFQLPFEILANRFRGGDPLINASPPAKNLRWDVLVRMEPGHQADSLASIWPAIFAGRLRT